MLSHFSLISTASLSSFSFCSLRRSPNFHFYPSAFFHFQSAPLRLSRASGNASGGRVPMDSPAQDLTASVHSLTQDLKNQSLESHSSADADRNHSEKPRSKLEALNWDHSFVRELPGDPRTDLFPREVLHACYTKVSPSAEADNPQLVAWSEAVADLLDLDHRE